MIEGRGRADGPVGVGDGGEMGNPEEVGNPDAQGAVGAGSRGEGAYCESCSPNSNLK